MSIELSGSHNEIVAEDASTTSAFRHYLQSFLRRMTLAVGQRRFAAKYFDQIDAEFEGLCSIEYKRRVALEVDSLRVAHGERAAWEVNHRYEYILNAGVPEPVLQQRCHMYRQRLKNLLGDCPPEVHSAFELQLTDPPLESLRASLLGILSEIQRLRHVRSEFERLRNRLFMVCAAVGFLFILFFMFSRKLPLTVSAHVVAAGILGGYFSLLLRLGAMHFKDEYNHNYHQVDRIFHNAIVTFALALFEGGVAAYLLYTLFLAGMLDGSLFPSFGADVFTQSAHHVADLSDALPASPSDTAKLLVWCFGAGFCERLVPDFLYTFSKERMATKSAKYAAPAPRESVSSAA